MAVADDLFQLIQSLTPSEKRYFKIHAKTHVGHKYKNSYEKLFDAMNYWPDGEEYDEKLFKRKHKSKTFLKNLPVEKNYLYELILETMRSFHDKKTIDRQINDLLLDEDFFRRKRLNEQRKKVIDKGKELAKKYEKMPVLLTLLEREKTMQKEWQPEHLKKLLAKKDIEEQDTLNRLNATVALRSLCDQLFLWVRINTTQSSGQLKKESQDLILNPIVVQYNPGYSFITDAYYYRIYALHHRIHSNMKEHEEYSKLIFELFELHYPLQKESSPLAYKKAIYNYLNACFASGNLMLFPELLTKARAIPTENRDEVGEEWQNLIHLELIYLSNTGQLQKAMELSKEIERGLKLHKTKINKARELALYYNLGATYFVSGKWSDSLDYYNKILSDKTNARMDLKDNAELFIIVLHFELKNIDILPYLSRNLLRKQASINKKEIYNLLFKYIRSLTLANESIDIKNIKALQNALALMPELACWLEAKQQRKTIEQVFRSELSF